MTSSCCWHFCWRYLRRTHTPSGDCYLTWWIGLCKHCCFYFVRKLFWLITARFPVSIMNTDVHLGLYCGWTSVEETRVLQCVTNGNCHAINYQRKNYTCEFISSRGHEMSILEDQDSSCVPLYSAAVQLKPSPMWKINAGRSSDVGFHGRQGQSQGWSCICKQYHLSLSSRIWACIIAWGPIYTWPKVLVCLYKTHTMRLPDLEYCILTLTVDLT